MKNDFLNATRPQLNFANKVLPSGYEIIPTNLLGWLYDNHRNVYYDFYEEWTRLNDLRFVFKKRITNER